jgi:uncharacterized protein (TIGR03083 family)
MEADGAQRSPDPSTPNYLTHLARDSARFLEVLRTAAPRRRVPTCPEWDADDLLWHLTDVQWFWATIIGQGLTTDAEVGALVHRPRPTTRDELLTHFDQANGDLLQRLKATSTATPAWTWSDDHTVGFIRRRQAHEALIHRLDAELTAGDRTPMDPDLCSDGVDEALRFMHAGAPAWGCFTPDPTRTVRIRTSDTASSWLLTLGRLTGTEDDGTTHDEPDLDVAESDTGEPAAATISGAAADLDCWLWHRPPRGELARSGDPAVLDGLDQVTAPAIS